MNTHVLPEETFGTAVDSSVNLGLCSLYWSSRCTFL